MYATTNPLAAAYSFRRTQWRKLMNPATRLATRGNKRQIFRARQTMKPTSKQSTFARLKMYARSRKFYRTKKATRQNFLSKVALAGGYRGYKRMKR